MSTKIQQETREDSLIVENGVQEPGPSDSRAPPLPGTSSTADAHDEYETKIMLAEVQLETDLESFGEVILAVGDQAGWGPSPLTKAQLGELLVRLTDTSHRLGAVSTVLYEEEMQSEGGQTMHVAHVLVRRELLGGRRPVEVRVAVIGNVDSGKSTMVGVLTRSMLDDGRGLARSKVFKHDHESCTGRTSSIGQHTLCISANGSILNDNKFKTTTCADYVSRASKVITLVDLAGHEKYFKTTAYGLTAHLPDYGCLIVGANANVVGMFKEHLFVALSLKIPVFFVITKIDLAPEQILQDTKKGIANVLKQQGVCKRPLFISSKQDVVVAAQSMHGKYLAPIFLTSAVDGEGLEHVRLFVSLLTCRQRWAERQSQPAEFLIDETFMVAGVGTVVAGTVKSGTIQCNKSLLLGPDISDGLFKEVGIKSIHFKRLPVPEVRAGQTAALSLKRVRRADVRKGMALVDASLKPQASWEFDADIAILTHSTTIQAGYQAVIHCEIVRQTARVIAMNKAQLRSRDRAQVRFRFMQRPEYVTPKSRFVFREGRTKGIGIITKALLDG